MNFNIENSEFINEKHVVMKDCTKVIHSLNYYRDWGIYAYKQFVFHKSPRYDSVASL